VVVGGDEDFSDGCSAREGFAAGLVTVKAGEEGDTGGVALGGVVELGEAEAIGGEGVEVWGIDFGAVAAEVGEAEVIGHDENDIGAGRSDFAKVFDVLKLKNGLTGDGLSKDDEEGEKWFHSLMGKNWRKKISPSRKTD